MMRLSQSDAVKTEPSGCDSGGNPAFPSPPQRRYEHASMTRLIVIGIAFVVSCAFSGNTPAQTAAAETKTSITIGATSNTLSSVNRLVADTADTFGKNGLEIRGKSVYFNGSTSNMIAGVLSGDVDFGYGGATAVVNALRARAPIQIVGVTVRNVTELALGSEALKKLQGVNEKSSLEARVAALKGMTIATAPAASTNNVLLRQLLIRYHLDPAKDVTIVTADPNSIPSGIRNGRFDAGFWTIGLLEQNYVDDSAVSWINVADAKIPGFSDMTVGVVVAKTSYIQAHPATVQAYHKSLVDAGSLIEQGDPATKKGVKAKYFPDLPDKTFDLTWRAAVSGLASNASMSRAGFQSLVDFMKKASPDNDYSQITFEGSVWEGARE
jgi:NitT/TauT family transport system substrate-binding protein